MDEVRGFDEEERKVADSGTGQVPAPIPGTGLAQVDFGDAAGAGMEGITLEEQLTPFLRILQKGSPQVDPSAAEYMPDARPGMLLNTATGDLYPGQPGVEAIVCARDYHYGAWVPRDSGGGFRGMLRPEDPIIGRLKAQHGRFKKLPYVMDGEAVELVETIQLYLIYAQEELNAFNGQRAIAAFASTALPVAQQYITKHNSWRYQDSQGKTVVAPIYQYKWRCSLVPQQNASGSWFNWKIDLLPIGAKPVDALVKRTDPLYAEAEAFYQLYKTGAVKADYSESQSSSTDSDVPF